MTPKVTMLIGPRSTPAITYGMSIGFDLLISGFEDRILPHIVIDRTQGMEGKKIGTFTLGGTLVTFSQFAAFYKTLHRAHTVYMTIGTSRAGFFRDMIMTWSARFWRKRIVLHLHGGGFLDFYQTSPAWLQAFMRQTFARTDTIIVLGKLLRDQFEFVPEINNKLAVVPNGLPKELENQDVRTKEISPSEPFRVLYLSNMIPSKGYLDVLEACRILRYERQIPIQCDFCGAFLQTVTTQEFITPATAEDQFNKLIQAKKLEGIVSYHGTVRGIQKQHMLQQAHAFVLPTNYPWEGQPISIIEALAFALPVVATEYRGIPEQVVDGYNGFLLKQKTPGRIADAIETLWRDPVLYNQLSQNALDHYQKNFTQKAHLDRLIPIILGPNFVARSVNNQEQTLIQSSMGDDQKS
ncbi:MAG TPA: glycosyltransferase [Chromatiaceae bacterium]|nr:glycosyltransferase [Chromatiaceae bacterium]